ncbi:hypothetical protein HMPREF1548_03001 [Clostridium sp. KLE 1755]|nr:hypothetical protein HMPREF1548_03001 [Clostridium sp. KLE 1755]
MWGSSFCRKGHRKSGILVVGGKLKLCGGKKKFLTQGLFSLSFLKLQKSF